MENKIVIPSSIKEAADALIQYAHTTKRGNLDSNKLYSGIISVSQDYESITLTLTHSRNK